jgi:hypothetical protein
MAAAAWAQEPEWIYVVHARDTLIDIARELLDDPAGWQRVAEYNRIKNPRRLQLGQRLRIPVSWLRRRPAEAKVTEVRGDARLVSAGQTMALTAPMALGPGAEVEVGEGGQVTLEFADGSVLVLRENSRLVLDALSTLATTGMVDTRLRLQRGRVDSRVAPLTGPGSRFEIDMPSATAAVRGTEFRASVAPQGSTSRSEVLDGTVGVAAAGAHVDVPAGFGTVVEAGKPPSPPRRLLPPPTLPPSLVPFTVLPVQLTWSAVPDAARYRVRLVPTGVQTGRVREAMVEAPELILDDLADGSYRVAVRAIDAVGLEGFEAAGDIVVQALLPSPQPLSPETGAKLHDRSPRLAWSAVSGARGYRLIVLHANRDENVGTWEVTEPSFLLPEPLPEGSYRWRVAALDARGQWSEPSATWDFSVKDPPRSPSFMPADSEAAPGTLRWVREPDQRIRVQIAPDPQFGTVLLERTLDADGWSVPGLQPGTYYARASAIDRDGEESGFGPARAIVIPLPAVPEAPRPVAPASGTIIRTCHVEFEWTPAARARDYQLVVYRGDASAEPLVEVRGIADTRHRLAQPLDTGTFVWTVVARDGYGQFSLPSAPARLECRPEPPAPALSESVMERRDMILRWPTAPGSGIQYDVEIARDAQFEQVVLDTRVSTGELRWQQPQPGRYHVRMRVVEADGYLGAFGPAAAIEVEKPLVLWPLLLLLIVIPFL